MNKILAIDRNEQLKQLLESARDDEQVDLTVDGKLVGRAVPMRPRNIEEARAAMARILELAEHQTLDGLSIKDLINEGRKY